MLGLCGVGKTTILKKLNRGKELTEYLQIAFDVQAIETKGFNIYSWDLGSRDYVQALWPPYFQNAKVLIFVVEFE
jgi:GTPase SAR1 family protein